MTSLDTQLLCCCADCETRQDFNREGGGGWADDMAFITRQKNFINPYSRLQIHPDVHAHVLPMDTLY